MREFYSWYLIPVVGLTALTGEKNILRSIVVALSVSLMTRYLPYLYYGEYSSLAKSWQTVLFLGTTIFAFFILNKKVMIKN
jgi:hypothetical protein